jgi:hypothetical protein
LKKKTTIREQLACNNNTKDTKIPVFFLAACDKVFETKIQQFNNFQGFFLPESLICIRAKPDKSSKAANDTFKSVFHEEISR